MKKTPLEIAADNFYAHLDVCRQCEGHPFQLCPVGDKLLLAVGDSQPGPVNQVGPPPEVMDVLEKAIRAIAQRRGLIVDEESIRRAREFCNQKVDPETGEKSMADISMHELQLVVDKIHRLTTAMRASGLDVKVTADVNVSFAVRVDEPKAKREKKK